MAVEYETLVQGGHSKFAEEIFKKIKNKSLVDEIKGSDSVPYHFRKTPYGDRLKEKIIGGTVAWNQLLDIRKRSASGYVGITWSYDNGTIIFNGTAESNFSLSWNSEIGAISGHKYFCYYPENTPNIRLVFGGNNQSFNFNEIVSVAVSETCSMYVRIESGTTLSNAKVTPQIFDLTAMFGTAIADYIYSLEQTTAGAGVALFRELFPKDYYEYDAGSLQSVSGLQSHDEVGFNQWDEQWELGSIDGDTGANKTLSTTIRSKNYIPVSPNTTYYAKTPSQGIATYFYDADKNYLGVGTSGGATNQTFTTPTSAYFMRFRTGTTITVYNHDICINLSDPSKNGQYEPYKKHSYPLDSSLTLRGVPKLVDNKIQFDGDVYESSGKVTRRYGVVDLGTLVWALSGNGNYFITSQLPYDAVLNTENAIMPNYTLERGVDIYNATVDKAFAVASTWVGGARSLIIRDTAYTDAASFKAAMSGVMLVYELATPTEVSALPYTNPQRCVEGGTEEYVTTGIVPVGHESEYVSNKAERFDALPDAAQEDGDYVIRQTDGIMELVDADEHLETALTPILGDFADIETSPAASNHAVGDYLIYDSKLYKVLAAISAGQQLTIGTNVGQTNVAAELASQASAINALDSNTPKIHCVAWGTSVTFTCDYPKNIVIVETTHLFIGTVWETSVSVNLVQAAGSITASATKSGNSVTITLSRDTCFSVIVF